MARLAVSSLVGDFSSPLAQAVRHTHEPPAGEGVEDWELQVEFEHLPEQLLAGEGYLEPIISVIELKASEPETKSAQPFVA